MDFANSAYLKLINHGAFNRQVTGACPMCGSTLHLTHDGTIICDAAETCPAPLAVTTLLSDPEREHIVRIEDGRFHVKHPLRERVNDAMLDCNIHTELSELDEQPAPTGVYRVYEIESDPDSSSLHEPRLHFEAVT